MEYVAFHNYLPLIAEQETRAITLSMGYMGDIPLGVYALLECYCNTPDCDCRRVMLHVYSEQMEQVVAVINFGWESKKFYEKWLGDNDEYWIMELKGPSLNSSSQQSLYANELLSLISGRELNDKYYVDRLKRHYDIFKNKVKEKEKTTISEDNPNLSRSPLPPGRNDPCSCGSGQKYKKCCGV